MNDEARAYLKTHPWIDFRFFASNLEYSDWLLLGEAFSKCEHLKGAPLLPKTRERLFQIYLAKGALATTAIEGNTLTEEDVIKSLRGELTLPPSKEYLGREIENVVNAYNAIGNALIAGKASSLSVEQIKEYNRMVLDGLPLKEEIVPGEIRTYNVGVAHYKAVAWEDCEYLLERYVKWLNDEISFPEGQEVIFGIIKAILAHLYFVWIHPFGDGNGRTARLIEFQLLLSVGIPAASAHLLSNHYNATRSEYYRFLEASSRERKPEAFIRYALQGFVDGLRDEIEVVQSQQQTVHWINFVHNSFSGRDRDEDKRRKGFALALSEYAEGVEIDKARYLSPKIAEMYAGLSDRTVLRDIQMLIELDLVVKEKNFIRCKWEILRNLISPVVPIKSDGKASTLTDRKNNL